MLSMPMAGADNQDLATGEILEDQDIRGRERPWRRHKVESRALAAAFRRLGFQGKAARCQDCGSMLIFEECPVGHEKRLAHANFCRERLCAMCQWRRSIKLAVTVEHVAHEAVALRPGLRFVLLTLTVRNVDADKLPEAVEHVLASWGRLIRQAPFKRSVLGWQRSLEVTRNREAGTWHPHLHVLLAVGPSYFTGAQYIKHAHWVAMWAQAAAVDYLPSVEVHVIKPRKVGDEERTVPGAAAEVAKYATKPADYIDLKDEADTDATVRLLTEALAGTRLVAWGGLLRQVLRDLMSREQVDDLENGDLVHLGQDHGPQCTVCGSDLQEHLYHWVVGVTQYVG